LKKKRKSEEQLVFEKRQFEQKLEFENKLEEARNCKGQAYEYKPQKTQIPNCQNSKRQNLTGTRVTG
jgi:hypothetical protein